MACMNSIGSAGVNKHYDSQIAYSPLPDGYICILADSTSLFALDISHEWLFHVFLLFVYGWQTASALYAIPCHAPMPALRYPPHWEAMRVYLMHFIIVCLRKLDFISFVITINEKARGACVFRCTLGRVMRAQSVSHDNMAYGHTAISTYPMEMERGLAETVASADVCAVHIHVES